MFIKEAQIQEIWKTKDLSQKRQKFLDLLLKCSQNSVVIHEMKKQTAFGSQAKIDSMAANLLLQQDSLKVIR